MSAESPASPRPLRRLALTGSVITAAGLAAALLLAGPAVAAQPSIGLGTAGSFAVLAGSTITNTGPSTISGDVGVSPGSGTPGTDTPGLTSAMVTHGTIHQEDATAASAEADLTTAYTDAANRTPATLVPVDLAGQTLGPGLYGAPTLELSTSVTLDAGGNPAAVFILQSSSTLVLASDSSVRLTNGASACNVFWQVGSSATLGSGSAFVGTILAQASISANHGATVQGRLLASTGAVTLDDNAIVGGGCAVPGGPSSTTPGSSTPSTPGSSTPGSTMPSGGTSSGGTGPGGTTSGGVVGGVSSRGASGSASGNGAANAGGADGSSAAGASGDGADGASSGATDRTTTGDTTSTTITTDAVTPPELSRTGSDLTYPLLGGILCLLLGCAVLVAAASHRTTRAAHRR